MNEKRRCAFAVCGSFCTLETDGPGLGAAARHEQYRRPV